MIMLTNFSILYEHCFRKLRRKWRNYENNRKEEEDKGRKNCKAMADLASLSPKLRYEIVKVSVCL